MRAKYFYVGTASIILTVLFCTASVEANPGTKFGTRVGLYTDTEELFVGGELLSRIAPSLYFNPNVEWVAIDGGTFLTFNGDLHYAFPTRRNPIWIGSGLSALYVNPDGPRDGNTDLGMNLLFGLGFSRGPLVPYLQLKAIIADNNEVVLGFGLRF
jgi:hypothetical protein